MGNAHVAKLLPGRWSFVYRNDGPDPLKIQRGAPAEFLRLLFGFLLGLTRIFAKRISKLSIGVEIRRLNFGFFNFFFTGQLASKRGNCHGLPVLRRLPREGSLNVEERVVEVVIAHIHHRRGRRTRNTEVLECLLSGHRDRF
jgi:hypothetical protein